MSFLNTPLTGVIEGSRTTRRLPQMFEFAFGSSLLELDERESEKESDDEICEDGGDMYPLVRGEGSECDSSEDKVEFTFR